MDQTITAWYDVAEWAPEKDHHFWLGPGRFDQQGGAVSTIKGAYLIKLEIIRIDRSRARGRMRADQKILVFNIAFPMRGNLTPSIMVRNLAWLMSLALASGLHAVEFRMAAFNVGAHLVVPTDGGPAYFDYGIGPAGGPDHDAVRDVLARLDADVVALEEIHSADVAGAVSDLDTLASSLGYAHIFVCPTTTAFDSSLRVVILSRFPFLSTETVVSPPGARDMNRLMPVARVDIPDTVHDPWIIAAHLKSGSAASDQLQRAAEMKRLKNFLTSSGITASDNFIVTGDFNLSANERIFMTLPASGLPGGFNLGDTPLPLTYFIDPQAYFSNPQAIRIVPRQLDGSIATFPLSGSAIDLFLTSPLLGSRPMGTEIYNSALDLTNIDGLPKAGVPLPAPTSGTASDHLAIFGDFELDPAEPYAFHAAGETVTETFDGFPGSYDPYPWVTDGGKWRKADDGSSHSVGFRSYGPSSDPSLGVLTGATLATATASFANQSPDLLRALRISFTAEQWRCASGGSQGCITVELIDNVGSRPLPALDFTATNALPDGAIIGGVSTGKSMALTGLEIAPGETFQLRFTFAPAAVAPTDLFINAFHYDNAGTDQGEFVEIVAGPGFEGEFADISVLLYNGSDGKIYRTYPLKGPEFTRSTGAGNFDYFVASFGSVIQNGPDGIALVNIRTREVIRFLSYEGSFTATEGIAVGMTSTDIGVVETGTEPVGNSSLGLIGSGGNLADFTWVKLTGSPSIGAANTGQTLLSTALAPQGMAIDNLAVSFLSDSDGDGLEDRDELVFGTDPEDASSRFQISIHPAPGKLTEVSFPTLTGRNYGIESSTDLVIWREESVHQGSGNTVSEGFSITHGESARFFRVRVALDGAAQ